MAHETRRRAMSNPFHPAWPAPATHPAESRDTEMSILRRVRGRAGPVLVVAVLAVVALLVTGCGSDGDSPSVATASNSSDQPSSTTTTTADQEQQALQFTKCMRENGVDMADPTVDTDGNLRWQPPDMSGSSQEELQKARDACQQYLQGLQQDFMGEDQTEFRDSLLKYAQCMRDNGYDLPDPNFSNQGSGGPFGDAIDEDDRAYEKADAVCGTYLPGSFGGGGG